MLNIGFCQLLLPGNFKEYCHYCSHCSTTHFPSHIARTSSSRPHYTHLIFSNFFFLIFHPPCFLLEECDGKSSDTAVVKPFGSRVMSNVPDLDATTGIKIEIHNKRKCGGGGILIRTCPPLIMQPSCSNVTDSTLSCHSVQNSWDATRLRKCLVQYGCQSAVFGLVGKKTLPL